MNDRGARDESEGALSGHGKEWVHGASVPRWLYWLLRAPVDLRRDDVVVMETTEHRESDDRCAAGERTPVGWHRNPLRYPLVWSSHVEIAERVLVEHALQMRFTQNDHMIETLPPNTTHESLA